MRILLTGANGYIGKRLLPILLEDGHQVVCSVRDKNRFWYKGAWSDQIEIAEIDFLDEPTPEKLTAGIDVAYYLIHSLSVGIDNFETLEVKAAQNFKTYMEAAGVKQVIYLGGIANDKTLSRHLESRRKAGEELKSEKYSTTILRAGIIVGSGSASFEIMRDLVEKLPVMIAPRWLKTKSQPIAIRNVLQYLKGVMMVPETFNGTFDIGGPDVLNYREMLLRFAAVRGLRRYIFTVPIMTPRLSSYWLYMVTSTTYNLSVNLVSSMKTEVICEPSNIQKLVPMELINFDEAVRLAYDRIGQNLVMSSWKDSLSGGVLQSPLSEFVEVPVHGCFIDERRVVLEQSKEQVLRNIWLLGGKRGWYYATWLWKIRGYLDKLFGGIGLRRGRTHPENIYPGDALDFWRVLFVSKEQARLMLFAEMKLPGEAWLEFKITEENGRQVLTQIATFRPHGLLGRLYWYTVMPLHFFVFDGMLSGIANYREKPKS